jgi:hypothetical protein
MRFGSGKMREVLGKARIGLWEDAGMDAFILVKWRFFSLLHAVVVSLRGGMVSFWLSCFPCVFKNILLKTIL